jgi:hypothetical protein
MWESKPIPALPQRTAIGQPQPGDDMVTHVLLASRSRVNSQDPKSAKVELDLPG